MQDTDLYVSLHPGNSHNVIDLSASIGSLLETLPSSVAIKKRQINRACDACRRRKTKCDGPQMPDHVCSNCIQSQKACTYLEASKPRGPSKAYVTGLEDRLESLEALLKKLQPDSDFSEELGPPVIRDSWKNEDVSVRNPRRLSRPTADRSMTEPSTLTSFSLGSKFPVLSTQHGTPMSAVRAHHSTTLLNRPLSSTPLHFPSQPRPNFLFRSDVDTSSDDPSSSDSEELVERYSGVAQRLTLRATDTQSEEDANQVRYHGYSSSLKLLEVVRKFKQLHIEETRRHSAEHLDQLSDDQTSTQSTVRKSTRRAEFWCTPPWELTWEGVNSDSLLLLPSVLPRLPSPDLARELIDIYFLEVNLQFPLLHRPTFERQWQSGLQNSDPWFTCMCFSLFAVASRWSDDPRVLPPPAKTGKLSWSSAGATFFEGAMQITRERRSLFYPGCLFEIQSLFLMGLYLRGTVNHPVAWLFMSIGIRKAQDVGAHRKKVYDDKPSVEEELWKRAFWLLVALDRFMSAMIGRACAIGDEDFDIDPPLEVDDEYWESENPALAFRQPLGKPSTVCFFTSLLKLSRVAAFALKTVYAVNQSKVLMGLSVSHWREEALKQMSAVMAEFVNSIPPHLKWSDNPQNSVFANQSATLYTSYYALQVLVYRPFTRLITRSFPIDHTNVATELDTSSSAKAMCIEASRSCARIIDHQLKTGSSNISALINIAQICCAALLANFWEMKIAEQRDAQKPMTSTKHLIDDIFTFIRALEWAAPRWEIIGHVLQKLRACLPEGMEDDVLAPPLSRLSDSQHQTSFDRALTHNGPERIRRESPPEHGRAFQHPLTERLDGWQWAATAQVSGAASEPVDLSHLPPEMFPRATSFYRPEPSVKQGFPQLYHFVDDERKPHPGSITPITNVAHRQSSPDHLAPFSYPNRTTQPRDLSRRVHGQLDNMPTSHGHERMHLAMPATSAQSNSFSTGTSEMNPRGWARGKTKTTRWKHGADNE